MDETDSDNGSTTGTGDVLQKGWLGLGLFGLRHILV